MRNKYLIVVLFSLVLSLATSCSTEYYDTKNAGDDFLTANKNKGTITLYKDSVVGTDTLKAPIKATINELPSGIQYAVYWTNSFGYLPQFDDISNITVSVKYKVYFINGTVFKSESTETLAMSSALSFWSIIIPKMKIGSKWRVWVPYNYAYGSDGNKKTDGTYDVDPYSALIYDVELLSAY